MVLYPLRGSLSLTVPLCSTIHRAFKIVGWTHVLDYLQDWFFNPHCSCFEPVLDSSISESGSKMVPRVELSYGSRVLAPLFLQCGMQYSTVDGFICYILQANECNLNFIANSRICYHEYKPIKDIDSVSCTDASWL